MRYFFAYLISFKRGLSLITSKHKQVLFIIVIVFIFLGAKLAIRVNDNRLVSNPVYSKDILAIQIQQIFNIRNHAILSYDKQLLKELYDTEQRNALWAYDQQLRTMDYLKSWAEKQGIKFEKIESDILIKNISQKEGIYSINLINSTEYQYTYQTEEEKTKQEINSFRLGTYHNLDIKQDDNDWKIKKDWHLNPFLNSLYANIIVDEIITEKILAGQDKSDVELIPQREKAIEYADEFCGAANLVENGLGYNPEYKNYNYYGGDCANFVSQILYEAGGIAKNNTWNYQNNTATKSWVNAHAFNQYMLNSGRGSLIDSGSYKQVLASSYKLLPGDYIAYQIGRKVNHVSVVTGFDSKGYILTNSHNSDRYRAPWDLGWNKEEVKFWLVRVNY